MKHILKAQSFYLEMEVDILGASLSLSVPVNTILYVNVQSGGFGAATYMDVTAEQFACFCDDLYRLYRELRGSARIHEAFVEENYIEFSGDGDGRICVTGCLNNHWQDGMEQEIRFENMFTQDYLGRFARELYDAYRHLARRE